MYLMRRHLPWLASLAVGLVLLGGGAYMVFAGLRTRDELRQELRAEQVMTSDDTARPGVLIEDAETARMQADAIKQHTLGTWGPYSELPRDDPRRAQFIDGVTLRTALNMAVMGFGVTQLVIGGGLIILLAGPRDGRPRNAQSLHACRTDRAAAGCGPGSRMIPCARGEAR